MLAYPATVAFLSASAARRRSGRDALAYVVAASRWRSRRGPRRRRAHRVALQVLGMVFATGAGAALAHGRERLSARAARAEAARRRLLGASLTARTASGDAVSHDLHGEALQVLLAARQDLEEAAADGPARCAARGRACAAASPCCATRCRDLHPASVRHVGLRPAIVAALEHRLHGAVEVRSAEGDRRAGGPAALAVRELGDALAAAGHRTRCASGCAAGPTASR